MDYWEIITIRILACKKRREYQYVIIKRKSTYCIYYLIWHCRELYRVFVSISRNIFFINSHNNVVLVFSYINKIINTLVKALFSFFSYLREMEIPHYFTPHGKTLCQQGVKWVFSTRDEGRADIIFTSYCQHPIIYVLVQVNIWAN